MGFCKTSPCNEKVVLQEGRVDNLVFYNLSSSGICPDMRGDLIRGGLLYKKMYSVEEINNNVTM